MWEDGQEVLCCSHPSVPGKIISDPTAAVGREDFIFSHVENWRPAVADLEPGSLVGMVWEVDGQKAVICGYLELSLPRPFLLLFTGARNHLVYLYTG